MIAKQTKGFQTLQLLDFQLYAGHSFTIQVQDPAITVGQYASSCWQHSIVIVGLLKKLHISLDKIPVLTNKFFWLRLRWYFKLSQQGSELTIEVKISVATSSS